MIRRQHNSGNRHRFGQATAAAGLLVLALAGCAAEAPKPPPEAPIPPPEGTPKLVLFLVVDQGRFDYFERFRPLLSSGLARLLDESTVFTQARHDHALTNTAPGHATLVTGVHPARHGIVNNWWFDRATGKRIAAVGEDITPRQMLASSIGGWLKTAFPQSKVFAAGGKDRAAVLTGGKSADAAWWTNWEDGRFITSAHYLKDEPEWLTAYHADLFPDRSFGNAWEPLPEVVEHTAAYGLEPLDGGWVNYRFPHPIGAASPWPDSSYYFDFTNETPFGDAYLADFATALIDGEQLGQDAYPDFLGLGFSALDKIGHGYGPDSPEVLDTFLRLDLAIGGLLDFIDRRIGLENTIISLSADHGVTPVPEVLQAKGIAAKRFGVEEITCAQNAHGNIRDRFGDQRWFSRGFYLDRKTVQAAGLEPMEIARETRRLVERCPGVVRAWTVAEMGAGATPLDGDDEVMRRLYANSFHLERSSDLVMQLEPHTLRTLANATTHGTPYDYDRHVPWLLRLPASSPSTVDQPVSTVDVAPTIAGLLGLTPPEDLDGVDRRGLLPPQ